MKTEDIKQHLRDLFDSQRLAVVATQQRGQPYTSLVAFVTGDDLKEIYFATPRGTRKYANIEADPRVAVLINNSINEDADIHRAISVTALGKVCEVGESERPDFMARYLRKHPYLEGFIRSPSCAWLKVTVARYYMVKNFQEVVELHVAG